MRKWTLISSVMAMATVLHPVCANEVGEIIDPEGQDPPLQFEWTNDLHVRVSCQPIGSYLVRVRDGNQVLSTDYTFQKITGGESVEHEHDFEPTGGTPEHFPLGEAEVFFGKYNGTNGWDEVDIATVVFYELE